MNKVLCLVTAWPRYMERAVYLNDSLESLKHRVDAEGCDVDWVVTSETERCDPQAEEIQRNACRAHGFRLVEREGRPGLGSHLTDTISREKGWDVLFYTQEDWLAVDRVPLGSAVEILRDASEVAMARLLMGGKKQHVMPLPGGSSIGSPSEVSCWARLDPSSEWLFAHNPYVARREFIEALLPMEDREGSVNNKAKQVIADRGWEVFTLREPYPFAHIGEVPAMTEKHAARRKAGPGS